MLYFFSWPANVFWTAYPIFWRLWKLVDEAATALGPGRSQDISGRLNLRTHGVVRLLVVRCHNVGRLRCEVLQRPKWNNYWNDEVIKQVNLLVYGGVPNSCQPDMNCTNSWATRIPLPNRSHSFRWFLPRNWWWTQPASWRCPHRSLPPRPRPHWQSASTSKAPDDVSVRRPPRRRRHRIRSWRCATSNGRARGIAAARRSDGFRRRRGRTRFQTECPGIAPSG